MINKLYKFTKYEEKLTDDLIISLVRQEIKDIEEARLFFEQFIYTFKFGVKLSGIVKPHNQTLCIKLIHKISIVILISSKLTKLGYNEPINSERVMKISGVENKGIKNKEMSDSLMIHNRSTKAFPSLIYNDSSEIIDSDKQIDEKGIHRFGLNSEIWDDVFGKFYSMKYEIFINTFEHVYKGKLPFTHDGKDFNSKNMIKAFKIHSSKIQIK